MKRLILIGLCWICLVLSCPGQTADRIGYNHPGLEVDLGVGLWGTPLPWDYDGDGLTDLLVSCADVPYRGLYFFRNIGTKQRPFFARAEKLCKTGSNNIKLSVVDGAPRILTAGYEWPGFMQDPFSVKREIAYRGDRLGEGYKHSRSHMWGYVDWDDDGDQDILVGIDTWDAYGWDNAFDTEGNWKNGPLHGYVFLLENVAGQYVNRGKILAGGSPVDVFGAPNPCVADFDGDGDLDLICGEFLDGLTWFENTGTRKAPVLAAGRPLSNRRGEIRLHLEMIMPVVCDMDRDGLPDLVIGDEDGRVAWVRNTGKVRRHMPVFEDPSYLRQEADWLKFGALATPCAYDWDGDGKQDLICGNSSGEIALIRNLSGGDSPVWAEPVLVRCGKKPIRVMAGPNGSIQGPAEAKWGYTVLSVADWDGDGRADLIVNSIWGKIEWFRNAGSRSGLDFEPARPVIVEEMTPVPKPAWNWWNPAPGTLSTQWRTTPVVLDWNGDGLQDLIVLDQEGYLAYYERFLSSDGLLVLRQPRRIFHGVDASVYHNRKGMSGPGGAPLRLNALEAGASGRRKICFTDWDGDGRLDLIVDSKNACWFRNEGETDGIVQLRHMGDLARTVLEGHTTCPTPVDWSGDGINDILLGAEDGHFYRIRNPRHSKK